MDFKSLLRGTVIILLLAATVSVAACGGGASTALTPAPTPAPPTPTATPTPPQDMPLTTVIAMAKANEIREIQVDGKKLTIYPKTIARGGADSFASRIGDDTDIIGLLIDSGVEVGLPSGVEVTFKGVSAEDVQATISAALAQAATPIVVLVTPTPGPEPTLTPTPTANPTTIPLPQRPLIRLLYGGQVYDGVPGNSCWPVEPGASLCADEGPFPWQDLDLSTMSVTAGDSMIVEIEADDRPQKLQAAGVKLATVLPSNVSQVVNDALEQQGLNVDLRNLKPEDLEHLIDALGDLGVDIHDDNQRVRVYTE